MEEESPQEFAEGLLETLKNDKWHMCQNYDRLLITHRTRLIEAFKEMSVTERTRLVAQRDMEMVGYRDSLFANAFPPGAFTADDMVTRGVNYILWKYLDARHGHDGHPIYLNTIDRAIHLSRSESRAILNDAAPGHLPSPTIAENAQIGAILDRTRTARPTYEASEQVPQPKRKKRKKRKTVTTD